MFGHKAKESLAGREDRIGGIGIQDEEVLARLVLPRGQGGLRRPTIYYPEAQQKALIVQA